MAKTCVFCEVAGKLTREHVFGEWLSRTGLDLQPRLHSAGRLNRLLRDQGVSRPFVRKVQDVCEPCNTGWMARLEGAASKVLSPLVLGNAGSIREAELGTIAAWTHKTALVSMLMTPDADHARGDHFLGRELRNLYAIRDQPAPASQTCFWIGRYEGDRGSVWVTPMTVDVEGLPVAEFPQAYVMTVVVGKVLLQGVRFTSPLLEVELEPAQGFAQLWPPRGPVAWPAGNHVRDEGFIKVAKGLNLVAPGSPITLNPWKPATELERSTAQGDMVRLPTLCGEHSVLFPDLLVAEAKRGVFYAFITSCECGTAYLVVTHREGAACRAAGLPEDVLPQYEAMEGEDLLIDGEFFCKRLPA